MKNIFFLILGLVIIFGSIVVFLKSPATRSEAVTLEIGDAKVMAELALNHEERSKGLSHRAGLPEGQGMLFIFDAPDRYGFWMKDMNFPIDIVWIGEDWRVVGVEREVSPSTFPTVFYPPEPVLYVLELPSGFAERHGIGVGGVVQ